MNLENREIIIFQTIYPELFEITQKISRRISKHTHHRINAREIYTRKFYECLNKGKVKIFRFEHHRPLSPIHQTVIIRIKQFLPRFPNPFT